MSTQVVDGAYQFVGEGTWTFVNGTFHLPAIMDLSSQICINEYVLTKVYSRGWLGTALLSDHPTMTSLTTIMYQLLVFLIVSRTIYFILRPLKQPRIISDLITGIIFGPSVFDSVVVSRYFVREEFTLLMRTLGTYGLVFHLFLTGVKMDPSLVRQIGREALWVGVFSVMVPLTVTAIAVYLLSDFIPAAIARGKFLLFLPAVVSISAFPVMGEILAELRILNTELGRLGMSSAMINCLFGWFFMALFNAMQHHTEGVWATVNSIVSLILMVTFIVFVMGPIMRWIVKKTPTGTQVREEYIAFVLICVAVISMISEVIGASAVDGPVLLGLVIPDGPPLGSALVRRIELIVSELFMPLFVVSVGNAITFPGFRYWVVWIPTMAIVLVAYSSKVVGTMLSAMYCNVPFHNATILGFIMSFRGVVEIIILFYLKTGRLLDDQCFSLLTLLVMLSTAVAVPVVGIFYDPLATNRRWGRRTIEHMRTQSELLVLFPVHNDGPVPSQLKLIEATSSRSEGPMTIYLLHLLDLEGRSNSTLISHRNSRGFINPLGMDRLLNTFTKIETDKKGLVTVVPYTSIAPYSSMHQDICGLASEKRTALIILPYPRKDPTVEDAVADHAIRKAVPEILELASCSIGILIYRALGSYVASSPSTFQYHVGLLFWGGPDDREALSYASRMLSHAAVTLEITKFVPAVEMRTKREKQLDDNLMEDFRISHSNNARLMFNDVQAKDSEETLKIIRTMDSGYDLFVCGRRQGQNSCLSDTLLEWSQSPELGIVGDLLSSSDFKRTSSVLIMQQHG